MLSLYLSAVSDHSDDIKFTDIYYTYEKRVFSIALAFTSDVHDAEDASQAAWFSIARNIDKLDIDDESKTKIYVYKTIKNACYDILRKRSRSPMVLSLDMFFDIDSEDDISQLVENDEETHRLIRLIKGLPEVYRDVLSYKYIFGYSVREISDILNRPISTVKSQLKRGGEILSESLEEKNKK